MQYAIVIEKGPTSYGAYVPDLPGCVAVAETEEEVRALIREAIAFHIECLREDGEPIPVPVSQVEYVNITAVAAA
jgi:predicted RNase H-like HicB family nuclease